MESNLAKNLAKVVDKSYKKSLKENKANFKEVYNFIIEKFEEHV